MFPVVDAQAVAEIVESWTGIPAGRMQSNEINTVLNLQTAMGKRIVGQDHALEAVAQAIRTSRAKLTDPRKPIGVFLMVGTSGTGKTETALTLADLLYGGEQNMTTINMTEFKEEHKLEVYLKLTLTNTMISGYSLSSGGDRPSESLSLNFTKVEVKMLQNDPTGAGADSSNVTYDISTAKVV